MTFGFSAWFLLLLLALTSTQGIKRRLGSNWHRLHNAIYVIAILGVLHYIWLVKVDLLLPLIYAFVLALLLLARWKPHWLQRTSTRTDRTPNELRH